jgi:hypothetical protein
MSRLLLPPLRARALAVLDGVAILAFTVLGILTHRGALPPSALAEDALPLLAGWYAAAAVLGLYREPAVRVFLLTWGCGLTAGVLLRAAILGRLGEARQLAFLATTLVLGLAIVGGARAAASLARG